MAKKAHVLRKMLGDLNIQTELKGGGRNKSGGKKGQLRIFQSLLDFQKKKPLTC